MPMLPPTCMTALSSWHKQVSIIEVHWASSLMNCSVSTDKGIRQGQGADVMKYGMSQWAVLGMLLCAEVSAQQGIVDDVTVYGTVVDARSDAPLSFVTVTVEGSQVAEAPVGTLSNTEGYFE